MVFCSVVSKEGFDRVYTLNIGSLIDLFMIPIAVYIAVQCNPQYPIFYGFIAFLFSKIYIFIFLVRKYILKSPKYCRL